MKGVQTKMIKYIASFSFVKDGVWGFGNSSFEINHRIEDTKDLDAVAEGIRTKTGYSNVTILFFQEVHANRSINEREIGYVKTKNHPPCSG